MPRSPTLPTLRFVVVGADSSGKSTFIHHALDLKKPLHQGVVEKKMSLEGEVFMIRLTEIDLAEVSVDDDYLVTWPHLRDSADRRIDGVLALYDVSRRGTLAGVPDLLNACSRGNLPCVLVACKCDVPPSSRKIDPREVERSCMRETGIEGCQTYRDRPDTHKRCISVVLRNVISNRTWRNESRQRANTTPNEGGTSSEAAEQSVRSTHVRAVSERVVPTLSTYAPNIESEIPLPIGANHATDSIPAPGYYAPGGVGVPQTKDEREVESDPETPLATPLGEHDKFLVDDSEDNKTPDRASRPRSRLRPGTPITIANSLIDAESEPPSEKASPKQRIPRSQPTAPESGMEGYSFDQLVDRLVALPMTREDATFNDAFLCLYRKFASPGQLLGALFQRWEALDDSEEPHILTLHSQLRIVAILAHWVADYPGDTDYPLTRHYLIRFCEHLAESRIFAMAAREIMDMMDLAVPDKDLEWSVTDASIGDSTIRSYFKNVPELSEPRRSSDGEDWFQGINSPKISIDLDADNRGHRRYPSSASISGLSLDRSASFSVGTFSTLHEAVEAAKNQAELLTPLNRTPLTKLQWRQLMEYGDEDLASEMTRMDWIMYSALRPRDLIRHVSLSTSEKEKARSLEHLNRMINHFNHISFWTASMILLRDKAKHRAQALEKFIEVARKLRVQNNYNSLAAIIAGINGTSVHRLVQTRDLVPQIAQKEFMKLEILMGTRKGYFAYRLAWENTVGEKVPFLPLHIRDLVATEEGNPTYIGKNKDRINWKKFSIMGDTIVSIQESQGTPYAPIPRNAEMQRLILDGRISMDDEDIYERSVQVEPRGPDEPRRKFNLFQR